MFYLTTVSLISSTISTLLINMISAARDIAQRSRTEVSNSLSISTSPSAALHSPPSSYGLLGMSRTPTLQAAAAKQLKPFATEDIKILLLENVNKTGRDALEKQGYQVDFHKSSLPEEELIAKIR